MTNTFELEAREQAQLEQDYRDWCRRYDPKYVVEREEEEPND